MSGRGVHLIVRGFLDANDKRDSAYAMCQSGCRRYAGIDRLVRFAHGRDIRLTDLGRECEGLCNHQSQPLRLSLHLLLRLVPSKSLPMAEDVPKYDPERQTSLTGVAEGLSTEDDAAVLGEYYIACYRSGKTYNWYSKAWI